MNTKKINRIFFKNWTREQLIEECIRLNKVLFDCSKIAAKIGNHLKKEGKILGVIKKITLK